VGKLKPPEPALLFMGILYADPGILNRSKEILKNIFNDILFESPPMPWEYSFYYREEFGRLIYRQFLFFRNLIDPGTLADIKIKTNEIEDSLSSYGKRRINLDPGYLTLSQVVLASTKNYAHRIYLSKGIYAEVTLVYQNKTFQPHLFTYRDYQDKAYIDMFMNARAVLKKMLVNCV
jgi:hypothetical protein